MRISRLCSVLCGVVVAVSIRATAAPPQLQAIADDAVSVGTTYSKQPVLTAGEGVTWTKTYGPDELTVDATTGAVSWAISASAPREAFHVGVRASNAEGTSEQVWVLKVGGGSYRYVGPGQTYATISAATAAAASGDTIVIKNGTYTGSSNALVNGTADRGSWPPHGSPGVFSTIIAQTPGAVILDGQNTNAMVYGHGTYLGRVPADSNIVGEYDLSYIALKGVVVTGGANGPPISVNRVHHFKFVDCGAFSTSATTDDGALITVSRSQYATVEGCYTWGRARYQILFYISDHVIMRRCVVRPEYSESGEPYGAASFYACQHARGQDLIVIDGTARTAPNYRVLAGALMNNRGGWYPANEADQYLIDVNFRHALVLNYEGMLTSTQSSNGDDPSQFFDVIAWDVKLLRLDSQTEGVANLFSAASDLSFDQATIGRITSPVEPVSYGTMFNGWAATQTVTRSIVAGATDFDGSKLGVFFDIEHSTFNNLYDTGPMIVHGVDGTAGTTITTDPQKNGLLYLPRIESGSPLASAATGGSRVGAEMLRFHGRAGTLWGEAGFDDATGASCWPWPHEEVIKTKMASYPTTGARGFAASGQALYGGPKTLTSYIWEYLGHACPPGICVARGEAVDAGQTDSGTVVDSGTADSGTADSGTADSGRADSGTADSGTADSGTADSGTTDSGTTDSGRADSGTADSGAADAGSLDGAHGSCGCHLGPDSSAATLLLMAVGVWRRGRHRRATSSVRSLR